MTDSDNPYTPPNMQESYDARLMLDAIAHLMSRHATAFYNNGEDIHASTGIAVLAFMYQARHHPEWADEIFRITFTEYMLGEPDGGVKWLDDILNTLTPAQLQQTKDALVEVRSKLHEQISEIFNSTHNN